MDTEIPFFRDVVVPMDALQGGQLSHASASHIAVASPDLRCLDVVDCPDLEVLDLTQCQPGCHLTLSHCPSLRELRVPTYGSGAVIHADFGHCSLSLAISGLVAHVDACWFEGQFATSAHEHAWDGVVIRSHESLATHATSHETAQCWIALSPTDIHAKIDAPEVRHVLLYNSQQLKTLHVIAMQPEGAQIEAQELTALSLVHVEAAFGHCRIRHSPSLERLTGTVKRCSIAESADRVDALHVDAMCSQLVISHSALRALAVSNPVQLHLVHCAELTEVSLRPATVVECVGSVPNSLEGISLITVDEALVATLVKRYPTNPSAIMDQLASLIPSMYPASACVKALQLLAQLAEQGADPTRLWELRMALSAKHLAPRQSTETNTSALSSALGLWKWQLPDDLKREGWRADYAIWRYCAAENDQAASQYRRSMVRACLKETDGLAMITVVHAMSHGGRTPSIHERTLGVEVMRGMINAEPLSSTQWPSYARSLALQYGRDTSFDRLWLSACEAILSLDTYLSLLQRIGPQRPEIRARLIRLAQQSAVWREARCSTPVEAERYCAKAAAMALLA